MINNLSAVEILALKTEQFTGTCVRMLLRSLRHKSVHDLIGLHEVIGIEDKLDFIDIRET
ncbi:hypothetical protein DPMN_143620 [Dreissena polymorpha]|uniref:Uncharacterized protein n=1 Tax=Dreissena polymorpha TaxID=45954 RepID=A0A9D4GHF1_DREPO|nr:hypothetical protein DPMN_143620 [Dreissena polymorpha]